jgi:CheY-like chemotaxis protein
MDGAMRRVLLVEDDPIILRSTAETLAGGGFEVLEASGYDEALALLASGPQPSLLVTDIDLAGAPDGLALARSAAARSPEMRIVLVSGQVRPAGGEYPEKAIFFTKPYPPGALLTILEDCEAW